MQLARMDNVGLSFMAPHITEPVKTMRKVRLVCGRLGLARRAMEQFGLLRSPELSAEALMALAVPALEAADDKARKMAVRIVVDVYKLAGSDVVMPLIQHSKPATLARLQRRFDHADGKPIQPTKRSAQSVRLAPISQSKSSALPPLRMAKLKGPPPSSSRPVVPQLQPESHPFGSNAPLESVASTDQDETELMMDEILKGC